MEARKLLSNCGRCRKCEDFIQSKHRHDFQMCKCGAVGVDGGLDYLRRIGDPEDFCEESVFEESDDG